MIETMKITDIVDFNPSRTLKKGTLAPFVEMASIPEHTRDIARIATKEFGSGSKFKNGDTLFARITPCLENGKTAKVGCLDDDEIAHGSTEFIVMSAKSNDDEDFVYYLSRLPEFREYAKSRMQGTSGRQRVSWQALADYEFSSIAAENRKEIGKILRGIDDKIALNREMNKTLEAMAQAIFKSWFVDFEPFKEGEFVESELGMIPKGWEVGQLGDNIKIIDNRGKTPPICTEITEYPIIEVNALSGDNRTVNYSAIKKYVSEETYNSWFRAGHPNKNDILLSTVGSVGEVAMFPDNRGSIAQNVVALRAINTSPYYLYQALVNMKDKLKGLDIGSVQPSIKVTQMTKIHFLWPEQYVLEKFDSHVENLVQKIHLNETETEALSQVRDTLLPKLLSGEIEV
jgi:type I restriction enzyme S subunit